MTRETFTQTAAAEAKTHEMTAHQLARRLLELPDWPVALVGSAPNDWPEQVIAGQVTTGESKYIDGGERAMFGEVILLG